MAYILNLLIGLSILGCFLRFAYRWAFEGAEPMQKPMRYRRMRYFLDIWAAGGLLLATALLWWETRWWVAALWVFIDFSVEGVVTRRGEGRFRAQIMDLWRKIDPSLTPEALVQKAIEKLEFEKKVNAESGEYL